MWVVNLQGKKVFHDNVIVCTISKLSYLDKVRIYIKQKYNVEFETTSAISTSNWKCFNNITNDRDISLVVENVYTEDDIDAFLS